MKFSKSIYILFAILLFPVFTGLSQQIGKIDSGIKLARVKYSGGGDWYNDPSAEVNLLRYIGENTNINVNPVYEYVDLQSDNLFLYPLIFLTGHGNINFTKIEAEKLRVYLENGGFLYIDDDYGLDNYVREEFRKVFPGDEFVELPFNHEIYHCHFNFENGPPKIHEHDDKPAQGFGLFYKDRLCVFYTYEANLGDGWPDPEIHNDNPATRELAFKMGTNIIVYALTR